MWAKALKCKIAPTLEGQGLASYRYFVFTDEPGFRGSNAPADLGLHQSPVYLYNYFLSGFGGLLCLTEREPWWLKFSLETADATDE